MGSQITAANCPKCGQRVHLEWGREQNCPTCRERLAACGYCGQPSTWVAITHQLPQGGEWLCDEHYEWEVWQAERLRELASPEANTPPPETARAIAARTDYEEKVRDVVARGEYVTDALFPYGTELELDEESGGSSGAPPSVLEAYLYYAKAVMDQDFGSVRVHRWELGGAPLYLVRCTTDGTDGWLELYDGDGTSLGYARTDYDCPAWNPKGLVRKAAFTNDSPEIRQQLVDAARRLRGQ